MASWTRNAAMIAPLRWAAAVAAFVTALLAGGWLNGTPSLGERSSSTNAAAIAQSASRERARLTVRRDTPRSRPGRAANEARSDFSRLGRPTEPEAIHLSKVSDALQDRAGDDHPIATATYPAPGAGGAAPVFDIEPRCASPPKAA
ncbi:MAG: hypothetical protein AAF909_04315 [Pseudomonadota bacterium]